MTFVQVEFTANEQALAEEAIVRLKELMEEKGYTGWEYSDADLEIILIGILAGLAMTAAQLASVVPNAIFRQFGTQLLHVAFNEGAAATATTKWIVKAEPGVRQIPAGTQIEAGGKGFYVETETEVKSEVTEVNVPIVALERGTEYNKIEGVATQVNPLAYVTEIKILGETSGGTNEETDEEYLVKLAAQLTLQAPRPITAENYATFILGVPSTVVPSGVVVGRATSIDGYKEGTVEAEGKVTSGSAKMKEVTSYVGLTVGTEIIGNGVPIGTEIEKQTSIEEAAKELTMTAVATATEAKQKYKFVGTYNNERYVTTWVTNKEGLELTSEAMSNIETWLKGGEIGGVRYPGYREMNFIAKVEAPQYTEIYVTTKVHLVTGYVANTVEANIKSALKAYLSPEKWGVSFTQAIGSWENWSNSATQKHVYGTVRYNQLIGVIEGVQGVAYVFKESEGLKIGRSSTPTETVDIVMKGPAPLPKIKEANIVISTG